MCERVCTYLFMCVCNNVCVCVHVIIMCVCLRERERERGGCVCVFVFFMRSGRKVMTVHLITEVNRSPLSLCL